MSEEEVENLRKEINHYLGELQELIHPKETKHYKISRDNCNLFFHSLFIPIACVVPFIVLTALNECLTYAINLYGVVFGLYIGMFTIVWFHYAIYNSNIEFCSESTKTNHLIIGFIVFSLMGSGLGFINLYTYDFEFWYLMSAIACILIMGFFYFLCLFQNHHLRTCSTPGAKHVINDRVFCGEHCTYEICFGILLVLFFLTLCGVLVVFLSLRYELYNEDERIEAVDADVGCSMFNFTTP